MKDTDTLVFMTVNYLKHDDFGWNEFGCWLEKSGYAAMIHEMDFLVLSSKHLRKPIHAIVHELCERDIVHILLQMGFKPDEHGIIAPIQNTYASHVLSPYKDKNYGKWRKTIKSNNQGADK